MAVKWEDNVMGLIPKTDWLQVGFDVRRQNDPIDSLFGDLRTDNIMAKWNSIAAEYQIPVMAQFHGFDTEARTTFRIPVDTRNIEKGLIKVKINQSERMRSLLRDGVQNDQMYDYVINDGVRLADQVFTRSKVAKNELMATGKVTIKENDLDITVDYGVPAAQTGFTIDLAGDIDSQLQGIANVANDLGITINGMLTSKKVLSAMRRNGYLQTTINGTASRGAMIKMSDLEAHLSEEFDITNIITNDLTYGADGKIGANGRPVITTKRYYPADKITFFASNPGGKMGIGLWGDPPEIDTGNFYPGGNSPDAPYVYVTQKMEWDPAVLWTKASGLFIPVLYNPNSLFIANVTNTGA